MNEMYPDNMMMACQMGYEGVMDSGYPMAGHFMNERLVKTIQNCEATCEHMTNHVKMLSDYQMRIRQAMLLRDCADICGLTAKFAARGSMFARQTAALCACICENCGAECARFPDQMSQNCSRICLHCARECRAFAGV